MSLSSLVADLATRIGQEVKAVRAELTSGLSGKADDNAVVKLTGAQSVGGVKTFTSGVSLPNPSLPESAVRNDDTRLSNARTPTAHASTHAVGGTDVLTPAAIGAIKLLTATGIKTSAYTANDGEIVTADDTAGSFTVTLPAATNGRVVGVRKFNSSGNTITIQRAGTDTIGGAGATTLQLKLIDQCIVLHAVGGLWVILWNYIGLPSLDARYALVSAADSAAGTASIRTLGTGATQAAAGNDSRFTDARTPTGAAGGDLAGTYPNPTIKAALVDPVAGTAGLRTLGTGATQAAAGNDARLSDERDSPAAKANAANGWAKLDGSALLPQAIMPAIALTEYLGQVASQSAMLALTGQRGDWCYRTDTGTDWQLVAEPSSTLASWQERHYPASPVSSVNGRVGAVTGLAEASALAGYQPIDSDLTAIAALSPADGSLLRRVSGAWAEVTTAALKAALGLVVGDVSGAAPTASPSFTGTATFGGRTIQSMIALTDAATIAVDAALGNNFAVTLGGNRTMGAPSNATVDGQEIKFRIRQDGTGSRTITWTGGTGGYEFAGDIASAPTLTTGTGRVDYVAFKWDATTQHWHCIGYNRGHL